MDSVTKKVKDIRTLSYRIEHEVTKGITKYAK